MAGLAHGGEVAVTNDGGGIASALVERFKRRGYQARVIADEAALTEATAIVIALDGLRSGPVSEHAERCRAVFRLARSFAPRAAAGDCVFVSVHDCGGDFGLRGNPRAILGSLAGLIKTAAQEWPQASVKAIDLECADQQPEALAHRIEAELFGGGPELEIGLHADGRRTTLRSQVEAAAPLAPTTSFPLPEQPVVVCSGGARGVTAATMVALARACKARLALLGRTPLQEEPTACRGIADDAGLKRALLDDARSRGEMVKPADLGRSVRRVLAQREIRATLAAIAEAGGEAVYLPVDVTDSAQLTTALDGVRQRWGAIDAVVHGAGVVADKLIAEKTDAQFARVWSTKVDGLQALLQATADDSLSALILFASVAARSGNVGQCDYAMANEALNKMAAYEASRRAGKCIVKSLNWGPWEAGMVTPSLKAYFEEHGVPLIPLRRGADMLLEELATAMHDEGTGQPRIEVVLGGPPQQASIAGADGAAQQLDVLVDQAAHPQLADHAIDGTVVLPVVMVLELFARAAEAFAPGMQMVACESVRMFRGVRLDNYAADGDWLRISAFPLPQTSPATVAMELSLCDPRDPQTRYYAATVALGQTLPAAPPSRWQAPDDLSAFDLPAYGSSLFHERDFQVLAGDIQIADDAATAPVSGLHEMRWPQQAWATDPAVLDGGLQLALLWSQQRLGGHALPTGLASLRRYQVGACNGAVSCRLRARADGDSKGVSDIEFVDATGQLIAEMTGVETHKRP